MSADPFHSFETAKIRQWRDNYFLICFEDKNIFSIFFEDLDIVSVFVNITNEKVNKRGKL